MPKRPLKLCAKGHRQTQRWKPEDGCTACAVERAAAAWIAERAGGAVEERKRWQAELGPAPDELVIHCGDGGLVRSTIPPRLRRGRRGRPL